MLSNSSWIITHSSFLIYIEQGWIGTSLKVNRLISQSFPAVFIQFHSVMKLHFCKQIKTNNSFSLHNNIDSSPKTSYIFVSQSNRIDFGFLKIVQWRLNLRRYYNRISSWVKSSRKFYQFITILCDIVFYRGMQERVNNHTFLISLDTSTWDDLISQVYYRILPIYQKERLQITHFKEKPLSSWKIYHNIKTYCQFLNTKFLLKLFIGNAVNYQFSFAPFKSFLNVRRYQELSH